MQCPGEHPQWEGEKASQSVALWALADGMGSTIDPRRNQLTRYWGMTKEGVVMIPDATPLFHYRLDDVFLLYTD